MWKAPRVFASQHVAQTCTYRMVHAHLVMPTVKDVSAKMSASTANKAPFSSIHRVYSRTVNCHVPLVKDLLISALLVRPALLMSIIYMKTNVWKLARMVVSSGKMSPTHSIQEFVWKFSLQTFTLSDRFWVWFVWGSESASDAVQERKVRFRHCLLTKEIH